MRSCALARYALLAILPITLGAATAADGKQSLVITPFLAGAYFCDDAAQNARMRNEEEASAYCALKRQSPARRIDRILNAIAPKTSPSGNYQLGYTLNLPLLRYFKKSGNKWVLDADLLRSHIQIIKDVDRKVVVYLSANHFTDANIALVQDLLKDRRNLMQTRDGPLLPEKYFTNPVIPWTLEDGSAPINELRRTAFHRAVDEICALPPTSRQKIVGVSVLGEVNQMFSDFSSGPRFATPLYASTDYSPIAVRDFRQWLQAEFKTIDQLNRTLDTDFASFEVIKPPSKDGNREPLKTPVDHIDAAAAGTLHIYGWAYDKLGRDLIVRIKLDGRSVGTAKSGLNRADVQAAKPEIRNINTGYSFELDYRQLGSGAHTLEIETQATQSPLVNRSFRTFIKREGALNLKRQDAAADTTAPQQNQDTNIVSVLDGPIPGQTVQYNPLARLWLAYRNFVVTRYVQDFAAIVGKSCLPKSAIFSHQPTPSLNGGWNGDLMAVDASKQNNAFYSPGTTLYAGAAFGSAFLEMKKDLGWTRYSVNELNPLISMQPSDYRSMFEMHRKNGAVFVSPYFISLMPGENLSTVSATPDAGDRARNPGAAQNDPDYGMFLISPNNRIGGARSFYRAIQDIMKD